MTFLSTYCSMMEVPYQQPAKYDTKYIIKYENNRIMQHNIVNVINEKFITSIGKCNK
jgi:hypothetical protein